MAPPAVQAASQKSEYASAILLAAMRCVMFPVLRSVLLLLLSALVCVAQQTAPASQAANQSEVHTTIPLQLAKSLDAKKLKAGDQVVAKTSVALRGNGMTIPIGSRVVGHVTQAQARSKGDAQSALGIVFDKIELTGGKEFPIQGYIQAVGPNPVPEPTLGAGGGGTIAKQGPGDQANNVPGPVSTLGGIKDNNSGPADNQGTSAPGPLLNPNSHGVVGISHLELDKDSVLVTTDKDLKLESGMQILIRTFGQSAQSQ
jgi:hypothetical protein